MFDRLHQPTYDSAISKPFIIEELPHDPGVRALVRTSLPKSDVVQRSRERAWSLQKASRTLVAAAGGELFVADSREEVAPAGTPAGHAGA